MKIVREADDKSTLLIEFWITQEDVDGKSIERKVRIRVEEDRIMVAPEGYGSVKSDEVSLNHWPFYLGYTRHDQFLVDFSYNHAESYSPVFVTPEHARKWNV